MDLTNNCITSNGMSMTEFKVIHSSLHFNDNTNYVLGLSDSKYDRALKVYHCIHLSLYLLVHPHLLFGSSTLGAPSDGHVSKGISEELVSRQVPQRRQDNDMKGRPIRFGIKFWGSGRSVLRILDCV